MIVKKLLEELYLKIDNEEHVKTFYDINSPGVYRAGLEISGFEMSKTRKNIIVWGSKEDLWFSKAGPEKTESAIDRIFAANPPAVILSTNITKKHYELILKIANKYGVPIVGTKLHVSELTSLLSNYISEEFAPSKDLHASLVEIDGIGVMIQGESGIGKSEAVLELIQSGYNFISDDTVKIKRIGNHFVGLASPITEGFLEVRGLGLIDIPYVYGVRTMRKKTEVQLVIHLSQNDKSKDNEDRLGVEKKFLEILGSKIPKVIIPVKEGKSVAALIVAAVNLFLADKQQHTPLEEIQKRVSKG